MEKKMYDQNNIFAKILRGEIPCKKVYEDDAALAFHDISAKAAVHVLVIPKGPYISFSHFIETSPDVTGFYKAVLEAIKILDLKEGFRLISNSGLNGGQEVPHFHIHILGGQKLGPMMGKK
jgi:diadenosine tetraphosphate (Ap4A) HIT family hydrolase